MSVHLLYLSPLPGQKNKDSHYPNPTFPLGLGTAEPGRTELPGEGSYPGVKAKVTPG